MNYLLVNPQKPETTLDLCAEIAIRSLTAASNALLALQRKLQTTWETTPTAYVVPKREIALLGNLESISRDVEDAIDYLAPRFSEDFEPKESKE